MAEDRLYRPDMTQLLTRSLRFFLFLCLTLCATAAGFQPWFGTNGAGIVDLALVYQGGVRRLPWTPEQLAPYVSWTNTIGKEEWLYDGFLFIEFRDFRAHEYARGYGGKPARQTEWEWLLERNFEQGKAINALEQCVAATARRIGSPKRPRQVVLTLPEPIFGQTNWGKIDGRWLNFSNNTDRATACGWHVDRALKLWKEHAPKDLELAGFYWVAEHGGDAVKVLPQIAAAIHARGKRFYFIPYWRASAASKWRQLGFDAAYQQPNHFFHAEIPDSRLVDACEFARTNGMGMEMEFDSRAIKSTDVFRPRLHSYLKAFTETGAAGGALAWYEGGGALLEFYNSEDADVKALYRTVAEFIAKRQKAADQGASSAYEPH